MRCLFTSWLSTVVILLPLGARASTPDDWVGTWAFDASRCGEPDLTVVAVGTQLELTLAMGRESQHKTAAPGDTIEWMFDGAVGSRRVAWLQPKAGKLHVRLGVEGTAAPAPAERELVRCANTTASTMPPAVAVEAKTEAALNKALARYQKTFGPDWLDGSWGNVESGEDHMVAGGMPGLPTTALACPRQWQTAYVTFPQWKPGTFSGEPPAPAIYPTPDGTQIVVQGRWTFYTGKDGKRWVASPSLDKSRMGTHGWERVPNPVPLETYTPKPGKGTRGKLGVVLDGTRWLVSIKFRQDWRILSTGAFGTYKDEIPATVDASWFVLELTEDGGYSSATIARCQ